MALISDAWRSTGGQERAFVEIARLLAADHDVHVVAGDVHSEAPTGVMLHPVSTFARPEALRFWSFARAARRAVGRLHPDVVHGIGGNYPGADVVHVQTVNRTKYASLPEMRPAGRVRGLIFDLYRHLVDRAERRAYASPGSVFLAVSKRVAREVTSQFGVRAERVHVIPNGVDLSHFRPPTPSEVARVRQKFDLDPGAPVVAFVGADHVRKGLAVALRALTDFRMLSCQLVSVGGAMQSIRTHEALARELGVSNRVRLLPLTEEVRQAYWAADVFLFPTLYDPFGMAAAEAMACGCPTVLAAAAGISEFLPPDSHASILDPRDESAIASAIGDILDSPSRARMLSTEGRRAMRQFRWERVVADVAAVYGQVLASR